MFIILSHTCSRISYITDCTLKKDNNQVNPLLPRHIPAEVSDIHHISRVHSDYRREIGITCSPIWKLSFSAPVTRSIFTIKL